MHVSGRAADRESAGAAASQQKAHDRSDLSRPPQTFAAQRTSQQSGAIDQGSKSKKYGHLIHQFMQ